MIVSPSWNLEIDRENFKGFFCDRSQVFPLKFLQLLCTEFTSDIMMVNSLLCRLTFTLFFPGDPEQLQKLEREYYWIMVQVWLLVKLLLLETEFH